MKYHYRVTITGSTSWGICDPVGHLLEGAGRMSTDFRTIIGRKDTLSRTNRVNVRASRPAALPQGPARSRSLACSSRR